MLALGTMLIAETAGLRLSWVAARTATKQLEHAHRDLRALLTQIPPPMPAIALQIENELGHASRAVSGWQATLVSAGPVAPRRNSGEEAARRPEAFFDLAAFVEAMQVRAQEAGVILRPEERFGFSAFAHEAPEANQLADVLRERQMLQYLLDALMDAQPHQLLFVQRERPATSRGPTNLPSPSAPHAGANAPGADGDYFDADPRTSIRVPGAVEATAFRLAFTGHTTSLRAFLNKLAASELPVVVRAVEVTAEDSNGRTPPSQAPLVAPRWSRFVVTIEVITLVPPAGNAF